MSLKATITAAIYGTKGAWQLVPESDTDKPARVPVHLEILADDDEGFFLVESPEGFYAADSFHDSLGGAFERAAERWGLEQSAWGPAVSGAEPSCGEELAASADIPEQFARLFAHVAVNLRSHAEWVGTASPECQAEHDALFDVAKAYDGMSAAANDAANLLRTLAQLSPAPHDPTKLDKLAFARWMKTKIELQRVLASQLLEHAEQSERAAEEIAG